MRKNKYTIVSLIIATAFVITGMELFAADKRPPKAPKKNEVVIVFSLKVQPLPDTEFFANYTDMSFAALSGIILPVRKHYL